MSLPYCGFQNNDTKKKCWQLNKTILVIFINYYYIPEKRGEITQE